MCEAWFTVVNEAIQAVIVGKSWQHAFEPDGILLQQALVSPKLLGALGWTTCPPIAPTLPASGQASMLFPKRSKANVALRVEWKQGVFYEACRT